MSWNVDRLRSAAKPLGADAPAIGPQIGRYRIIREIAGGAMGVVHEAEDLQLKRRVALKVLREVHGSSDVVRKRFEREAQATAVLQHPNVVRVYDAGEDGGRMFLAMELVEGRSLREVLDRKELDVKGRVQLLVKAARGVGEGHAKGIVHRDVKPGNILVTTAGEPKVGDFGLAHLMDSETALTQSGSPLGTPLYMAPEQVRGDRSGISPATDVYALGAILYEMLTGRPPHVGENAAEIYARILGSDPIAPRHLASKIDTELEIICLKALETEADRRYRNANEFADDLERFLNGESILARPPGPVSRGLKWVRRHRAVGAGGIVALIFVAVIAVSLVASARGKANQVRGLLEHADELVRQGKLEEARAEFRAALEIDPSSTYALEGERIVANLIRLQLQVQRNSDKLLEAARAPLGRAVKILYRAKPDYEELSKEVAGARELLEKALALAPKTAVAHHLMGRTLELQHDSQGAERAFRKAIELDPDFGPAHYRLGRVLFDRMLPATLRRDPQSGAPVPPELRATVDEIQREFNYAAAGKSGENEELQQEISAGVMAFLEGDFDRGRSIVTAAIEKKPDAEGVEDLHWIRALVSPRGERFLHLGEAIRIRPSHSWARFLRALSFSAKGRLKEAVADYDEAIKADPGLADAWKNRGLLKAKKGDFKSAIEDCTQAIALDPTIAEAWANRAAFRFYSGDPAGALKDVDEAIARGRDDFETRLYRALCLEFVDRAAALKDARRALETAPKDWSRRGECEELIRRLDPAKEH